MERVSGWSGDGSGITTQSLDYYAGMSTYYGIPLLLPEVGVWTEATIPSTGQEGGTGDDAYFISELAGWAETNEAMLVLWCAQTMTGTPGQALGLFTSGSPDATAQAITSFGGSTPPPSSSGVRFLWSGGKRYRLVG